MEKLDRAVQEAHSKKKLEISPLRYLFSLSLSHSPSLTKIKFA